jgi:predicted transcriptional regulator
MSIMRKRTAAASGSQSELRAEGKGPWSQEALEEDERRLAEFERARIGVPWDEVKAWMQSWGKPNELPQPALRKL